MIEVHLFLSFVIYLYFIITAESVVPIVLFFENIIDIRCTFPAGIGCQNDVVPTSMRRNHVASTLI